VRQLLIEVKSSRDQRAAACDSCRIGLGYRSFLFPSLSLSKKTSRKRSASISVREGPALGRVIAEAITDQGYAGRDWGHRPRQCNRDSLKIN
jgi:hypothetical protein